VVQARQPDGNIAVKISPASRAHASRYRRGLHAALAEIATYCSPNRHFQSASLTFVSNSI
jgi:hypothetical protein